MVIRYSTGLVIGRFQPFHKGHDYLIKKALLFCDKLVIGIGSSNIKNKDNPLGFRQRKKILDVYLDKKRIRNKIVKIFPLPDNLSDDVWLKNAINKAGKIDAVISNNELEVNRFFKDAGFTVLTVAYYKRYLFEGNKIRKLIAQNRKWEDRVPLSVADRIKYAFSKTTIF